MSLLETAINDLAEFSSDDDLFSASIELTSPDGQKATLNGIHTRHFLKLDPNLGIIINSLNASIAVHEKNIIAANPDYPYLDKDPASDHYHEVKMREHKVSATDARGVVKTYQVEEAKPDHMLGLIVLYLSVYEL